jgi:penicillin-binding protein 2
MAWDVRRRRARVLALLTLAAGALGPAGGQRPVARADEVARARADAVARARVLDRRGRVLAELRGGGARSYPRGRVAAHLLRGLDDALVRALAKSEGEPGSRAVVLTIDLDLQRRAERALGAHRAGAAVVVEVETGRILALVSAPAFDPDAVTGRRARTERARLEGDPRQPLVDRALGVAYPPASTFKLVTAVAGLETGQASPDEEVTCTGRRVLGDTVLLDMGVHGTLDLRAALQHSCNIYFWQIGERVGIDGLARVARDFGFGVPTGLGIDGDLAGHVPDATEHRGDSVADQVQRLNAAIGAGDVKATALQVAMAYAALANGGRLYTPQLIRRIETAGGRVVAEREPILRRRVAASATTLAVIRDGLWRAVNTRGGTAFKAHRGAVKMVGKTGTAPLPDRVTADEAHAWFAGWAPAAHPRIAVVVLVEHGGVGGTVAAPVARDIIDAYFTHAADRAKKPARTQRRHSQRHRQHRQRHRKHAR